MGDGGSGADAAGQSHLTASLAIAEHVAAQLALD